MHRTTRRTLALAGALAAGAAVTPPAFAATPNNSPRGAAFVQENALSGNTVVGWSRLRDGSLVASGAWATGGNGGVTQGAPFDALASQGSLVLDHAHGLLLAVNAGSGTLTVFSVHGATLTRRQVLSTGGSFPVSVSVSGDLVYVLNGGGSVGVTGFRIGAGSSLTAIPGSARSVGITNTAVPEFLHSPGQVGFTPDGRTLLVTTKVGGTVLGYPVRSDGTLAPTPAVTPVDGVPFSFAFDRRDHLVLTDASVSRTLVYAVGSDGSLTRLGASAPDGGAALCWNAASRHFVFGTNSGSGTLAAWKTGPHGDVTQVGGTGAVSAVGDGAPLDLSVSSDDDHLYALNPLTGTVQGWSIGSDGSLAQVEDVAGLPQFSPATGGPEGLVAS
ncbi:6-phosphogluconolactonase (cycloisomerase 2 family) [Motilibacter peucedani]|uniref:6-phosphogluconolactonase (Cycloisomerase 2 family) n=1 Tax=Motilibacter peucedani TaxID=598650 RepID=A0A420XNB5_9ACTN|nr:hypothetical protein [Motilibacter peucedani]RKS72774.1 6-phosphogluconolactonase (cycloisomerase 2 family) [Motilibacter peucedani]